MTPITWPLIPSPFAVAAIPGAALDLRQRGQFALIGPAANEAGAARLAASLRACGWNQVSGGLPVVAHLDPGLTVGPPERHQSEAFRLTISAQGLELIGASPAGLMAAANRFEQLRLVGAPLAPMRIEDSPAYAWRGLSVDIARSFFGPATLRRLADLAACYGLNVLHLHLSDDQGWRLQLRSFPELVATSGLTASRGGDAGFLTAAEFRKLDRYCSGRGVTLVPEIDIPGHTNAALHALPQLSPAGKAPASYDGDDVGFSRLHLDQPATAPFLREVFSEVAALTTGDYVHIGGDEAMALGAEEYGALVTIALDAVRAAGKRPVGWQEIAPAVREPGTLLEYWFTKKRPRALVEAVERGARVILAPGNRSYLDMKYHPDYPVGQDWAAMIPVGQAGAWDPARLLADDGVPADAIEGVEAAIWTEFIHREDDLLGLLLPRLAEVAQVAWSGAAVVDPAALVAQLGEHRRIWAALGLTIHWYPGAWDLAGAASGHE